MTDHDPAELIRQGWRLFEQGNYHAAIGCHEQAVDLARRSGNTSSELAALGWLPVTWGNLGEYNKMAEAATRLLARARQLDNKYYEMRAALRLANALASIDLAGRWDEIRPLLLEGLQTARQLGGDFYVVYHLMTLGYFALEAAEIDAGYQWLQDALNALTPNTEKTPFFRWRIYMSLSQWAKERNDKNEALRYAEMALGAAREHSNPSFIASAQRNLARMQRWRGELGEALALADEALATSHRLNNEMHIVEGIGLKVELLVDLGLREKAQAAYEELLAMDITNADHYFTIGQTAYKALRDLDGAEQILRQFLEHRPKQAKGWTQLALVLYDKSDLPEAIRCWREALKIRDENHEALAGLALGLWTQGERGEAVKIFGQALSLRPRCADPDWLDDELNWSKQAIEAVRPLIASATAALSEQDKGDAL